MSDTAIAWTRLVVFVLILLATAALSALFVYTHLAPADSTSVDAEGRALVALQKHLDGIDKRLVELESRRGSGPERAPAETNREESDLHSQASIPRAPRTHYRVIPQSALPSPPPAEQTPPADPAADQKLADLQQGVGALQQQANSNQEAWQATTDRLAEVAGELGAQHGQILQSQDELNQFLGRTERTALTFELRRGAQPEPVGPIRISLKNTSEKSQRYTICVYIQKKCVQVRDRILYEVVQLAVARGAAPLELIATKVGRDEVVGYLEVPRETSEKLGTSSRP